MTNITEMPPADLTEMEKTLLIFKENLPTILEYHEISARLMKAKYNALIDEGFTPDQALELCRI